MGRGQRHCLPDRSIYHRQTARSVAISVYMTVIQPKLRISFLHSSLLLFPLSFSSLFFCNSFFPAVDWNELSTHLLDLLSLEISLFPDSHDASYREFNLIILVCSHLFYLPFSLSFTINTKIHKSVHSVTLPVCLASVSIPFCYVYKSLAKRGTIFCATRFWTWMQRAI